MGKFLGVDWRRLKDQVLPGAIKSILPAGLDSVVDILTKNGKKDIADEVRKQFSTDEAKLEYEKLALEKLENDQNYNLKLKELELQDKEAELKDLDSARDFAKTDSLHGHPLSKIIRPVSAIIFIGIFLILFLTNLICGVIIIFEPEYQTQMKDLISLSESLFGYINIPLVSVLGLYFGTRHFEKRKKMEKE